MDRRVDESPTVELITSSGLGVAGGGFGAAAGLTARLLGQSAAPWMGAGPVLAAGSAGVFAGTALGDHLSGNLLDGFFQDGNGLAHDAFDEAADYGRGAEHAFDELFGVEADSGSAGDVMGDIVGGTVAGASAMGTGLLGGAVSLAQGAGSLFQSLFD